MIYLQIKSGQKLHLAYGAGEGKDSNHLMPVGHVSAPICGRAFDAHEGFRMSVNLPLGNSCKNCNRIYKARH
jgi:hypothetical protein